MLEEAQEGDLSEPDKAPTPQPYNWIKVKRRGSPVHSPMEKRPREQPGSHRIAITNQFTALSSRDEKEPGSDGFDNEQDDVENTKPAHTKLPPIVFEPLDNIDGFVREINKVIGGESFKYTTQRDGRVRVMCDTVDSFRELVRHCRAKSHPFTTHQLKQDRAFRCVIEGLHNTTSKNVITSELEKNGHKVRSITCARHRIEKYPIDLFFVDLEPQSNNVTVYEVIYIGNAKVKIVPPRASPQGWKPQCHRCQELGHTRSYCNKPWVCVKCGGDHPTTSCKKPKNAPPKCCFCKGPHPSNYRGCMELKRRMARDSTGHQQPAQRREIPFIYQASQFPNFGGEGQTNNNTQSYAYARATQSSSNDSKLLETLSRLESIANKQLDMMSNLIQMITLFMTQCRK